MEIKLLIHYNTPNKISRARLKKKKMNNSINNNNKLKMSLVDPLAIEVLEIINNI